MAPSPEPVVGGREVDGEVVGVGGVGLEVVDVEPDVVDPGPADVLADELPVESSVEVEVGSAVAAGWPPVDPVATTRLSPVELTTADEDEDDADVVVDPSPASTVAAGPVAVPSDELQAPATRARTARRETRATRVEPGRKPGAGSEG